MIRLMVVSIGLLVVASASAQPASIEVMLGEENFFYQHSFSKAFGNSRFGFFHASSLHAFYNSDGKDELMSQSYVTYPLTGFAKLAVGTFYASNPGILPAAALQFAYAYRDVRVFLVPRVDLRKNGSVEVMMLLEYNPAITEHTHFYSRAQFMTNYGPYHHNRSYQNFRAGLQVKQTTMGVALNIDERGSDITTLHNFGIFLRHEFN